MNSCMGHDHSNNEHLQYYGAMAKKKVPLFVSIKYIFLQCLTSVRRHKGNPTENLQQQSKNWGRSLTWSNSRMYTR